MPVDGVDKLRALYEGGLTAAVCYRGASKDRQRIMHACSSASSAHPPLRSSCPSSRGSAAVLKMGVAIISISVLITSNSSIAAAV